MYLRSSVTTVSINLYMYTINEHNYIQIQLMDIENSAKEIQECASSIYWTRAVWLSNNSPQCFFSFGKVDI